MREAAMNETRTWILGIALVGEVIILLER